MKLQVERFFKALANDKKFKETFESATQKEKNRLASFYLDGMSLGDFKKIISSNFKRNILSDIISQEDFKNISGGKALKKWLENTGDIDSTKASTNSLGENELGVGSGGASSNEQKNSDKNKKDNKDSGTNQRNCIFLNF